MPSSRVHEVVARMINEDYHYDDILLRIGTVAPDSWRNTKKDNINKYTTHFWDYSVKEGQANDYKRFYQKYHDYMNNPFYFGYLIHLMVDQYWKTNIDPRYEMMENNKKGYRLRDGSFKEDIDWFGYHESLKVQKQLYKKYNLSLLPSSPKLLPNFFCNIEELDLDGLFGPNGTINYINTKIIPEEPLVESDVYDIDEITEYIEETAGFVKSEITKLKK